MKEEPDERRFSRRLEAERQRVLNVEDFVTNDEPDANEVEVAFDDISGERIPLKDVKAARAEEMEFIKGIPLFEEASRAECYEKTGKAPISTTWVDVNKGRDGLVQIRSRLVARDFKSKCATNDGLFASMPPLEAKKCLFQLGVPRLQGENTTWDLYEAYVHRCEEGALKCRM